MPTFFITSSKLKEGRQEILDFIGQINLQYFEYQALNPDE
jgi:hypothetical protein